MNEPISIAPGDSRRVAAAAAGNATDLAALFHPVEHAILRKFFGLCALPSDPADLNQLETQAFGEPAYIGIDAALDEFGVENAVARICLGAIQERLPQWSCLRADGTLALNRRSYKRREHVVVAKPLFLFEINWADSGPGFSWPVAYWATFVPGYARWVVTASADGPDVWGCADIAIGHFSGQNIGEGAGQVIRKEWQKLYSCHDQTPWVELFSEGLIKTDEAYALRQSVWEGHDDL